MIKEPESIPVKARPIAERRLGKFRIVTDFLREEWPKLLPLFARVVIVRAETEFVSDSIIYTGLSDDFEIVDEGMETPWYTIQITQVGKDQTYRFVKVQP
jgi:hypothetical protein